MVERFNVVAGLVLGRALEYFPEPVDLHYTAIALEVPHEWRVCLSDEEVSCVSNRDYEYVVYVIRWLEEEGFIRQFTSDSESWCGTLSAKGIAALNVSPEVMDGRESLGNRLKREVAEKSWDLVIATIPNIISVMTK